MQTHKATEKCYFIAHGPSVHYGELEAGQEIVTGQNTLTIYDNELDFVEKLKLLDVEYNQDTMTIYDDELWFI